MTLTWVYFAGINSGGDSFPDESPPGLQDNSCIVCGRLVAEADRTEALLRRVSRLCIFDLGSLRGDSSQGNDSCENIWVFICAQINSGGNFFPRRVPSRASRQFVNSCAGDSSQKPIEWKLFPDESPPKIQGNSSKKEIVLKIFSLAECLRYS